MAQSITDTYRQSLALEQMEGAGRGGRGQPGAAVARSISNLEREADAPAEVVGALATARG